MNSILGKTMLMFSTSQKKQNENLRIEVNITLCHRTSANTVKQYKASFKNALGPTFQPLDLYQDHTHWIFYIQMYMETRM